MKKQFISITLLFTALVSCNQVGNNEKEEVTNNSFCKYNVFGEYVYENKDYSMTLSYIKEDNISGIYISLTTNNNPHNLSFCSISHFERFEDQYCLFILPFDSIQPSTFYRFNEYILSDPELNQGYDLNYNGYVKDFSIRFLGENQIEFQCKGLEKIVKEFYEFDIEETIILTNKNPFGCFDYDINISYNKFNDQQQTFIFHDLEDGEGLEVATKETILDYIFIDYYSGWNTPISKLFEKFGNVYLIDFNNDGVKDIAGFFVNKYKSSSPLYFKIYLNNGITYNEAYSEQLSVDGLKPVYFPSQMNNQNVLEIKYVHKDLTNVLYWDRLENKIKEHFTD